MVTTADALTIGAGIIGASTALELSRRGLNVLAVDKARRSRHGIHQRFERCHPAQRLPWGIT